MSLLILTFSRRGYKVIYETLHRRKLDRSWDESNKVDDSSCWQCPTTYIRLLNCKNTTRCGPESMRTKENCAHCKGEKKMSISPRTESTRCWKIFDQALITALDARMSLKIFETLATKGTTIHNRNGHHQGLQVQMTVFRLWLQYNTRQKKNLDRRGTLQNCSLL